MGGFGAFVRRSHGRRPHKLVVGALLAEVKLEVPVVDSVHRAHDCAHFPLPFRRIVLSHACPQAHAQGLDLLLRSQVGVAHAVLRALPKRFIFSV